MGILFSLILAFFLSAPVGFGEAPAPGLCGEPQERVGIAALKQDALRSLWRRVRDGSRAFRIQITPRAGSERKVLELLYNRDLVFFWNPSTKSYVTTADAKRFDRLSEVVESGSVKRLDIVHEIK